MNPNRIIWRRQPPYLARINPALGAQQALYGIGTRVAGHTAYTTNGYIAKSYAGQGESWYSTTSIVSGDVATAGNWAPSNVYTLVAIVQFDASVTTQSPIDRDLNSKRVFQFRRNSSNGVDFIPFNTSATPYTITTPGAVATGQPVVLVATSDSVNTFVTATGAGSAAGTYSGTTAQSFDGVLGLCASWAGTSGLSNNKLTGHLFGWAALNGVAVPRDIAEQMAESPEAAWSYLFEPISIKHGVAAASTGETVNPGLGALTLTGFAPTVSGGDKQVSPALGALTVTGFAPTLTNTEIAAPGLGALTVTGFAPTITVFDGQTVLPGLGALTLTGFAPTLTNTEIASPGLGALGITGFAPTITVDNGSHAITTDLGALTLTGFAPTVTGGLRIGGDTGGGIPARKRRKYRKVVEIDGRDVIVASDEEAIELLEEARKQAHDKAELAIARAAKATSTEVSDVLKKARRQLKPVEVEARGAVASLAEQVEADINQMYAAALRDIEIAARVAQAMRAAEEDDEEVLLLTA